MKGNETGVISIVGYKSNLSGEIFLNEKEGILSDRSIRQNFAPLLIEEQMNEYLFKTLKLHISEEIVTARKSEDKIRFNRLKDLQEIVYNPSTKNRNNQYFSKSVLEIAVDMEVLLDAVSEASSYVQKAYNDDKAISLLYRRSIKIEPGKGDGEFPGEPVGK